MAKLKALEMPLISGELPNKRKAEEYIIMSLLSCNCVEEILGLNEDIFFHRDLKEIFKSAKRLRDSGKDINSGTIALEMKSDKGALTTFDAINRELLGDSWTGDLNDITSAIFSTVGKYMSLPDSGYNIDFHIAEAKEEYIKRIAKTAAALLYNSEKMDSEKLLTCLTRVQADLTSATSENYASLFATTTEEDIAEEERSDLEGIGTDYYVWEDGRKTEIKIPRGAITLVCGLPGNCKSTFLRNLALRLVKTEKGQIIYLTFEESTTKAAPAFLNIYQGKKLTRSGWSHGNNIDRIREFNRGEVSNFENLEEYKRNREEFNRLRTSGRLKIISPNCSSRDIVSSFRAYLAQSKEPITAIFVDYIQFVRSGRNLDLRLDLLETLNDFLSIAKETNIPVIAAAQLAKKAGNPQNMGINHIAESMDLGRYANMVLCLWNSLKSNDCEDLDKYLDSDHYKKHLLSKGFTMGESGKLYIKVSKARDIASGADNVLDYDGNTGVVGQKIQEIGDLPSSFIPDETEDDLFNN